MCFTEILNAFVIQGENGPYIPISDFEASKNGKLMPLIDNLNGVQASGKIYNSVSNMELL